MADASTHRAPPQRTFIGESIEGASPGRRLKDLLLGDVVSNLVVAVAVVIGFFHGWLKLKFRHPIVTFAFDIPLILALLITFSRMRGLGEFLPPGRAGRVMRLFYAITAVSFLLALVLPWGAPPVVALAAVRGWLFSTLMFGLGYHLIVSQRQLHSYFLLIIVMSAVTAFYGTRQTLEEVEELAKMDPYFEMRLRGVRDIDDQGNLVLRRFSTFVSSGAFGGTMSVALVFLAALVSDRRVHPVERGVLLGLGALIGWGMLLSGSRTALFALGFGLIFIVWLRRLKPGIILLLAVCLVGFYLGAKGAGGGVTDRLARLEFDKIWGRFYIVLAPGWRYLVDSGFIGGGLGKAGVGVPAFMFPMFRSFQVWGSDGDLGKVMAEMGVAGTVVLVTLLGVALMDVVKIARRHRDDPVGTLAIGACGSFLGTVITFPTGSPFLGIPLGVLSWFFLGAVVRLDELYAADGSGPAASTASGTVAVRGGSGRSGGGAGSGSRTTVRTGRGDAVPETRGSLSARQANPAANPRAGRERMYLHYRRQLPPPSAGAPKRALPPPASPPPSAPWPPGAPGGPDPGTGTPPPSGPQKHYMYRRGSGSAGSKPGSRRPGGPGAPGSPAV